MTWLEHHKISEDYACDADTARWRGDLDVAQAAYAAAGRWEEKALAQLDASDENTFRIIAVSAVALFFKAKEYADVIRLSESIVERGDVALATKQEIEDILTKRAPRKRFRWAASKKRPARSCEPRRRRLPSAAR